MRKNKKTFSLPLNITRRDFLNGASVGIGATLLGQTSSGISCAPSRPPSSSISADWYGYGGVGDYRSSHGNTPEAVATAHRLHQQKVLPDLASAKNVEQFNLVIVGSGMAGLGAALEFQKTRGEGQTCLLLDNHPVFGGEAKENEFNVNGHRLIAPQGANGFFIPEEVNDFSQVSGDPRYYADLNIPREFAYREWPASNRPLKFCGDNYGYLVRGLQEMTSVGHYFSTDNSNSGRWLVDMWRSALANAPIAEKKRQTLLQWYGAGATRKFGSRDEARRILDTMSYKVFLEREVGLDPDAASYADLFLASSCGLGSDAISAYAAYQLPMPGLSDVPPLDLRRTSFPGGNSGFVRHFVKRLIPEAIAGDEVFEDIINGKINFEALDKEEQPIRMRQSSTVLSVGHQGKPDSSPEVNVIYERNGETYGVKANAVIMATGGWINQYVVRDMPQPIRASYSQFQHAPFLVANVALTNWRFLENLGITAAIWSKDAGDFGYTCNIRTPMQVGGYQPPLDPGRPTVLSFYTPFHSPGLPIEAQVSAGRSELLNTSYSEYEHKIITQMIKLFGASGFDPGKDVAGIILNRWGHAYSVPFPGFFGGAEGVGLSDSILKGYGRISFGHSELEGLQHYGPAADQGRRAFIRIKDML